MGNATTAQQQKQQEINKIIKTLNDQNALKQFASINQQKNNPATSQNSKMTSKQMQQNMKKDPNFNYDIFYKKQDEQEKVNNLMKYFKVFTQKDNSQYNYGQDYNATHDKSIDRSNHMQLTNRNRVDSSTTRKPHQGLTNDDTRNNTIMTNQIDLDESLPITTHTINTLGFQYIKTKTKNQQKMKKLKKDKQIYKRLYEDYDSLQQSGQDGDEGKQKNNLSKYANMNFNGSYNKGESKQISTKKRNKQDKYGIEYQDVIIWGERIRRPKNPQMLKNIIPSKYYLPDQKNKKKNKSKSKLALSSSILSKSQKSALSSQSQNSQSQQQSQQLESNKKPTLQYKGWKQYKKLIIKQKMKEIFQDQKKLKQQIQLKKKKYLKYGGDMDEIKQKQKQIKKKNKQKQKQKQKEKQKHYLSDPENEYDNENFNKDQRKNKQKNNQEIQNFNKLFYEKKDQQQKEMDKIKLIENNVQETSNQSDTVEEEDSEQQDEVLPLVNYFLSSSPGGPSNPQNIINFTKKAELQYLTRQALGFQMDKLRKQKQKQASQTKFIKSQTNDNQYPTNRQYIVRPVRIRQTVIDPYVFKSREKSKMKRRKKQRQREEFLLKNLQQGYYEREQRLKSMNIGMGLVMDANAYINDMNSKNNNNLLNPNANPNLHYNPTNNFITISPPPKPHTNFPFQPQSQYTKVYQKIPRLKQKTFTAYSQLQHRIKQYSLQYPLQSLKQQKQKYAQKSSKYPQKLKIKDSVFLIPKKKSQHQDSLLFNPFDQNYDATVYDGVFDKYQSFGRGNTNFDADDGELTQEKKEQIKQRKEIKTMEERILKKVKKKQL